jgi:CBS domain-containing protein
MRVQDVLRTKSDDLFVIRSSATIREAALTMAEKRVGMVLVVDIHGKLAGLLSERDIVQLVAVRGDGVTALPAEAAMAEVDLIASPNDSIVRVMRDMTERRVRHVPVLTEERLVGVISIGDILKSRLLEKDQEAAVLRDMARLSLIAAA